MQEDDGPAALALHNVLGAILSRPPEPNQSVDELQAVQMPGLGT